MSAQPQDDSYLADIIENMRMKETDELLEIWRKNNRMDIYDNTRAKANPL